MQFSKWVTLGFSALCLVAVAGVLNAQHLYYMAAILLTLPGISYGFGRYALRGLTFERELPMTAWEGEEGDILYAVENRSRVSRFFLTAQEPLPSWITPLDEEPPLFNVAARETARVVHRVRFRKRGVYRVQAFDVTAMDPLGVFPFTRHVPCDGEIVVYPSPKPLPSLSLAGTERYGWQMFTSIVLRGSSVDPDGVREYAPGDPLRRIHWRQTARTGQLTVIEFEESQAFNLVIALDLQRGTDIGVGSDSTLEKAVRVAASVAQMAIQQGAGVRLLAQQDESNRPDQSGALGAASLPGRGQEHLFLLLDALARVEANAGQPISALIGGAPGNLLPGTTLLVITAQADAGLPAALARYTSTGATVAVVYVEPDAPGGRGEPKPAQIDSFFADLMIVHAHPFALRKDGQSDLYLEAVFHANDKPLARN